MIIKLSSIDDFNCDFYYTDDSMSSGCGFKLIIFEFMRLNERMHRCNFCGTDLDTEFFMSFDNSVYKMMHYHVRCVPKIELDTFLKLKALYLLEK